MEYQNFKFEKDADGIAVLTMNRPEKLNALNYATFLELNHLFDAIAGGEVGLRGLIVTGAGRAFIAGADLSEIMNDSIEENRIYAGIAQTTLNKLEALPVPTVAAVNGFALGGGCEVALACDIRIASEKAKFGLPEVSLGVIPCFGGTQRLPALIGKGMAKEMIFTGRQVKADEALRVGLVNRVTSEDSLIDEARAILSQTIGKSASAIRYAKIAVNRGAEMALPDGLELERELSAICYGLPDKAEGIKAFFEKREVDFPSNKR